MTLDTVVWATPRVVSADLSGEAALLDLDAGVYYGLNRVGARIWRLLERRRSVREIRDTIVGEYDVEPERCEADLIALMTELNGQGLIQTEAPGARRGDGEAA
ncbi:MAG TPA: PqqD family protein [Candidatus Limnocylindrales bacterium]|jgi:hypothetical protein|nr:PqqD family protein [Candidatus Limnocylindrales bacterium]